VRGALFGVVNALAFATGCGGSLGSNGSDGGGALDSALPASRAGLDSGVEAGAGPEASTVGLMPTLEAGAGPDASAAGAISAPDAGEGGADSSFGGATTDDAGTCGAYSTAATSDGSECPSGTVQFTLDLGADSWWAGNSYDNASSEANWLTIDCPSGTLLPMEIAGYESLVDCSTCEATWSEAIGFGWALYGVDAGSFSNSPPIQGSWSGMYFTPGTCGPSATPCMNLQCAPAGRYVATMCVCGESAFDSMVDTCTSLTCLHVPFDYPAPVTVTATLPDDDAGGDE
jgi:hypothetical protein